MMVSPSSEAASRHRRWRRTLLQGLITLAIFVYLLTLVDLAELGDAFRRAPWWGVPAAVAVMLAGLTLAALRWRLLLAAYGAPRRPPLGRLFRLHLIGAFYNTLPGAVGGDVVRGLVTRDAFTSGSATAGIAVVFVERALGMSALLLVVATAFALRPIAGVSGLWLGVILGLTASGFAIAAIALGQRWAAYWPRPLRRFAHALPVLQSWPPFGLALLCSLLIQVGVAVIGHLFIATLDPRVQWLDSTVLAPLVFAAAFFPLTIAGAGTRDAAMVALYGLIGVARADSLAASLQIMLTFLLIAAIGAVLTLVTPLTGGVQPTDAAESS